MSLGTKILELRTRNGESQSELANLLHVTFQTISKWENDINSPDVEAIKFIANHFNVSIDYLLENNPNNQELEIEVTFNKEGDISVWTDFTVEDSIAPVSSLDKNRHRTTAKVLYLVANDSNSNYIAIDKNGKISFFSASVFGFLGADYLIGYQNEHKTAKRDCFILGNNYQPIDYKDRKNTAYLNCEFVVPENGFIIVIKQHTKVSEELMKFMLSNYQYRSYTKARVAHGSWNDFFRKILLPGDLNNINFTIKNKKIVIRNEKDIIFGNIDENIKLYLDNKLQELADEYEMKINELEEKIGELEDKIDNLNNNK